ncbi:DUF4132 domain-containing protein [Pseudomonas sp. GV071]|uniref:DUF4132 domain-containing protein n=1 Tax=Pseudomonas sp. GV071 TaxID=2135754 RepID=UPI000D37C521|nr:DUF4132 domain-containing protein [Pseudomonas sp. GV071]PTQ73853.1 uncharacterized protein DUF4132 [Pseudomonas sp. GV071]
MSTHDKSRFEAFIALASSTDEADFLARLQATYNRMGIGAELDFAALAQAWQQGVEPPLAWRMALAVATPFELDAYEYFDSYKPVYQLLGCLFHGAPTAEWIERGQRLAVLCAPLIRSRTLLHLLKVNEEGLTGDLDQDYDATLGEGLRSWAQQLAKGTGEWEAVSQWLRDAGSDPALLAKALASEQGPLALPTLMALAGLRVMLLLVREQLLLPERGNDTWADLLLVTQRDFNDNWQLLQRVPAPGLHHHYALPLLQALAASPRFAELLAEPSDRYYRLLRTLFHDLHLSLALPREPRAFGQLLARASNEALSAIRLADGFVAASPDCALLFEQEQFRRNQTLYPRLHSAEARAWYLSVIGQCRGYEFQAVLKVLQEGADKALLHQVLTEHFCTREDERYPSDLLQQIDNAEHLYSYLTANNAEFVASVAQRLFEVASVRKVRAGANDEKPGAYEKHPQNWAVLLRASEHFPALFAREVNAYFVNRDDPARWQLLWNLIDAEQQVGLVEQIFHASTNKPFSAQVLALLEQLYSQSPAPLLAYIGKGHGYYLDQQFSVLSKHGGPLLQLLPAMAARCLSDSNSAFKGRSKAAQASQAAVRAALLSYPQAFAMLEEKARIKLLALFDDSTVLACAAGLATLFESKSKTLREPALALIARSSPATLEGSGLLAAPAKARKLVLAGMAMATEPAMLAMVSRHFDDEAHDEHSRGLSRNALEQGGVVVSAADPVASVDLATLQAQAVGLKIPAAVKKYWNDEFAAALAPLGEPLALQLLVSLFEAGKQLPRRAEQLLEYVPAGRRADFAWLGVRQWVAGNGAVELDWLLLTLPVYGDDRIANELVAAVKAWAKLRKQKASAALQLLCQLPGNFGVAQARELWESGKFSPAIVIAAREALTEAATRRGLGLGEFLEQLVPDFGLGPQGLVLDMGPYQYLARIRPDFSLAVFDDSGKALKTLPKAKPGEDADKRSLAENQFKVLSKNLKPVVSQQHKRLSRLLQTGSSWSVAVWQKLFIEHPLMAVIAQSVVWSVTDAKGQPVARVRPTDGAQLIDLNDEPYNLPDAARLHVTHPLELDKAERAAWVSHFADYKLESPIEQWSTPVVAASAEILASDSVKLATGKTLNRGKFGSLVEKWGYNKGAAGDGAQIIEHTWRVDGGNWLVTLNHGDIDVYFAANDKVELDSIDVHRRVGDVYKRQRMSELPAAFLNTLLSQAQQLAALAK